MSIDDYNRVRYERPELFLPDYHAISRSRSYKLMVSILTPDRLIARRTAMLLSRKYVEIEDCKTAIPEPEPMEFY